MIRNLRKEVDELKKELGWGKTGVRKESQLLEQKRKELAYLEAEHAKAWEEREKISAEINALREKNFGRAISKTLNVLKEQKLDVMRNVTKLKQEYEECENERKYLKQKLKYQQESFRRNMVRIEEVHENMKQEDEAKDGHQLNEVLLQLEDKMNFQKDEMAKASEDLEQLNAEKKQKKKEIKQQTELLLDYSQNFDWLDHVLQHQEEMKFPDIRDKYLEEVRHSFKERSSKQEDEMKKRFHAQYEREKLQIQANTDAMVCALEKEVEDLLKKQEKLKSTIVQLEQREYLLQRQFEVSQMRSHQMKEKLLMKMMNASANCKIKAWPAGGENEDNLPREQLAEMLDQIYFAVQEKITLNQQVVQSLLSENTKLREEMLPYSDHLANSNI